MSTTRRRVRARLRWGFILFFATSILTTLAYRWLPVPVTPLMLLRCGQQWWAGDSVRLSYDWVPLSEMSPHMKRAVMASEDQRFYDHNGFDYQAISYALQQNEARRAKGKRPLGASTISQQTAKNVFLWPQSTWTRKLLEVYFTFLIETLWPKERIMEVYLNVIEMGPGIYGAEAVAQAQFNCPASELSARECALIAATLPSPRRYSSKRPGPYMRQRQKQILRQMKFLNVRE